MRSTCWHLQFLCYDQSAIIFWKKNYRKDKAAIGNVVSATQTGVTPDFLTRLILDLLCWWDIWHDCPCHYWASGTIGASSCADRYGTTGPGGPEPGKPVPLLRVAPQGLARHLEQHQSCQTEWHDRCNTGIAYSTPGLTGLIRNHQLNTNYL
jgi:hypothetical protein